MTETTTTAVTTPPASPPAQADPALVRGVLEESSPGQIVLSFTGLSTQFHSTNARMHLVVEGRLETPVGRRVRGHIHAQARRIDVVKTGGRFVEPVYGRPKRVQGTVVAIDDARDTVVVSAMVPFVCKTNGLQHARDFAPGQLVALDIVGTATFIPSAEG